MTGDRRGAGDMPGPLRGRPETHTPDFLRHVDPTVLRELAWLLEHRQGRTRRFVDPARAATELGEILERGGTPTIGWWRRNLRAQQDSDDPPHPWAGSP
jgi:hypothetical protein